MIRTFPVQLSVETIATHLIPRLPCVSVINARKRLPVASLHCNTLLFRYFRCTHRTVYLDCDLRSGFQQELKEPRETWNLARVRSGDFSRPLHLSSLDRSFSCFKERWLNTIWERAKQFKGFLQLTSMISLNNDGVHVVAHPAIPNEQ